MVGIIIIGVPWEPPNDGQQYAQTGYAVKYPPIVVEAERSPAEYFCESIQIGSNGTPSMAMVKALCNWDELKDYAPWNKEVSVVGRERRSDQRVLMRGLPLTRQPQWGQGRNSAEFAVMDALYQVNADWVWWDEPDQTAAVVVRAMFEGYHKARYPFGTTQVFPTKIDPDILVLDTDDLSLIDTYHVHNISGTYYIADILRAAFSTAKDVIWWVEPGNPSRLKFVRRGEGQKRTLKVGTGISYATDVPNVLSFSGSEDASQVRNYWTGWGAHKRYEVSSEDPGTGLALNLEKAYPITNIVSRLIVKRSDAEDILKELLPNEPTPTEDEVFQTFGLDAVLAEREESTEEAVLRRPGRTGTDSVFRYTARRFRVQKPSDTATTRTAHYKFLLKRLQAYWRKCSMAGKIEYLEDSGLHVYTKKTNLDQPGTGTNEWEEYTGEFKVYWAPEAQGTLASKTKLRGHRLFATSLRDVPFDLYVELAEPVLYDKNALNRTPANHETYGPKALTDVADVQMVYVYTTQDMGEARNYGRLIASADQTDKHPVVRRGIHFDETMVFERALTREVEYDAYGKPEVTIRGRTIRDDASRLSAVVSDLALANAEPIGRFAVTLWYFDPSWEPGQVITKIVGSNYGEVEWIVEGVYHDMRRVTTTLTLSNERLLL